MSELLTKNEMLELTGHERASRQIKALKEAGIPFVRRIDGHPTTTWTAVNSVLVPGKNSAALGMGSGFNLEALHGAKSA